jgi:hypothetical protein
MRLIAPCDVSVALFSVAYQLDQTYALSDVAALNIAVTIPAHYSPRQPCKIYERRRWSDLQRSSKAHSAPSTARLAELQQESFWSWPQTLAVPPAPVVPVYGVRGMTVDPPPAVGVYGMAVARVAAASKVMMVDGCMLLSG